MAGIAYFGHPDGYNAGVAYGERGERAKTLFWWLNYLRMGFNGWGDKVVEGHHQDLKSDIEFHQQCRALGIPRVIHPPLNDAFRHGLEQTDIGLTKANYTRVLEPEERMRRSGLIARGTDVWLAAPENFDPRSRSEVWAAVREAASRKLWTVIVLPNGGWWDDRRPSWCTIQDDEHIWDGDECLACGLSSGDIMSMLPEPAPSCRYWRDG